MGSQRLPAALDVQCESVRQFLKGFNSGATKEQYAKKLSQFLEMSRMGPDALLEEAVQNPRAVQGLIIDYVESQRDRVSGSTIGLSVSALKHFFAMNDAEDAISWKKITKIMPRVRKTGSDRAPTIEEIRQMMEAADTRTKCIILMCSSSGIRVGAFDGMVWGDVTPMPAQDGGGVRAARLFVYRGSVEEYVTFVTPECYDMLLKYMAMREEIGEQVTAESPLIRDSWDSHPYRKDARKDPRAASPLASKTISNMMGRFLKKANMRGAKRAGSAMHEFKQIHGFRKYFKTNAERTMKTIDVEKLMGHAENYYKPSEEYLLGQYAAAVPNLTISEEEELRRTVRSHAEASDKKVGEIERENEDLHERIARLESSYASVREILENVLISKTGGR
ncbi:MAG: hypothetical protein J4F28_06170 [Nitrosopumilaceae archaeon]|nr:hypothetical protein [Nitrosopumilaceae archaeon]